MTREQLNYLLKVLNRIKEPDEHIAKAIAYINKDLAEYDARRGQLREQYSVSDFPY